MILLSSANGEMRDREMAWLVAKQGFGRTWVTFWGSVVACWSVLSVLVCFYKGLSYWGERTPPPPPTTPPRALADSPKAEQICSQPHFRWGCLEESRALQKSESWPCSFYIRPCYQCINKHDTFIAEHISGLLQDVPNSKPLPLK